MSGSSELIDLINRFLITKGESITEDEVILNPPIKLSEVVARAFDRNTRIKITSVADPSDEAVIYYNRLDLPVLFGAERVPVDINFYTLEAAINRLNDLYGTVIELADIKSHEINDDYSIKFIMGQSFKFIEDSELTIYPETELTKLGDFSDRFHQFINFTLPNILEGVPDE